MSWSMRDNDIIVVFDIAPQLHRSSIVGILECPAPSTRTIWASKNLKASLGTF